MSREENRSKNCTSKGRPICLRNAGRVALSAGSAFGSRIATAMVLYFGKRLVAALGTQSCFLSLPFANRLKPFVVDQARLVQFAREILLLLSYLRVLAFVGPNRQQLQIRDHLVEFRHHRSGDEDLVGRDKMLFAPAQALGGRIKFFLARGNHRLTRQPH